MLNHFFYIYKYQFLIWKIELHIFEYESIIYTKIDKIYFGIIQYTTVTNMIYDQFNCDYHVLVWKICAYDRWRTMLRRVKANRKADTRLQLQTKLCGETMMRRPSTVACDRLFKVHNRSGSLSAMARKSDYKNRFILTGARDPTKTRAGP